MIHRNSLLGIVLTCALALPLVAQQPAPDAGKKKEKAPPQPPLKEVVATDIPGVIKGGTKIVLIREGFNATEGVIALNDGSGSVLFTEQDSNRIIKVDPDDKISTFTEGTARTTGLTYDPKGRLIGANSKGPASIGVVYPGEKIILADKFDGVRLWRPNDLIADKKGGFYFSDPVGPDARFPEPPPGRTSALLYLTPDGKVIKPTEDALTPNGIELTADEKTLYVTNGQIRAYDVQPDGKLTNGRLFAESGGDGLAIDSEGRLYSAVAAIKGIRVIDKTGKILGVIPSGTNPQSVGFAGKNRRTLYIVGGGALYKVQGDMLSQGITVRAK